MNNGLPQLWTGSAERRQWLVGLTLGGERPPPKSFFDGLAASQHGLSEAPAYTEINDGDDDGDGDGHVDAGTEDVSDDNFQASRPVITEVMKPSGAVAEELATKLIGCVRSFGDGLTDDAMRKMMHRLDGIKTSSALNSALYSFASEVTVVRGVGGGRKIRYQPATLARRPEGRPRGSAPLMRGRPPQPQSSAKFIPPSPAP